MTACDDITLTKLAFPDASFVSVGQRRTTEMGKAWYISDVGWMWGGGSLPQNRFKHWPCGVVLSGLTCIGRAL